MGLNGEVSTDNLAFCFVRYVVSYYAYSSCKCEDSAAVEVNNSCKSAAAHNIFMHKYTVQDQKTKHTRQYHKSFRCTQYTLFLSNAQKQWKTFCLLLSVCRYGGWQGSRGRPAANWELSYLYTSNFYCISRAVLSEHTHTRIHKPPFYPSTCQSAVDRFPHSQSLQRGVSDLPCPSIKSITVQSNLTDSTGLPARRCHKHTLNHYIIKVGTLNVNSSSVGSRLNRERRWLMPISGKFACQ